MKATEKKLHDILKNFIAKKNLTELCKELKKAGVVRRVDISRLFHEHYSSKYLKSKGIDIVKTVWSDLQHDLDNKEKECIFENPNNLLQELTINKNSGNYKKVLIEGDTHIYWAHPYYRHDDYNKSIWRKNTPENRVKMQIINNFLNK